MYHIKETWIVPGQLAIKAREHLKSLPNDWLIVTGSCKAFVSCIGFLDDTTDARELGPTIAKILDWEYGYEKVVYHAATNSLTLRSRTDK